MNNFEEKNQIINDTAKYGFARYSTYFISFFAGIVQKNLLGPTLVGIWGILALVRMYIQFGNLGITRAVELELPHLYSEGKKNEFEFTRNIGFSAVLVCISLTSVIAFILSFFISKNYDHLFVSSLRVISIVAIIESISQYFEAASLRCTKKFPLLGSQVIRAEILFSVLSVIGVIFFKLFGLILALAISMIYRIIFVLLKTEDRYFFIFNIKKVFFFIKMGFPLIIYALVMRTFENIDRLFIIKYFSTEKLGYYSIALMVLVALNYFPLIVSSIFYPRIVSMFNRTKEEKELIRYLEQSQDILLLCMIIICGLSFFIFPLVVQYLIPDFIYGINSMKMVILSALFSSLLYLPFQYCIVLNRRWKLLLVVSLMCLVYFLLLPLIVNVNFLGLQDLELVALMKVLINFSLFFVICSLTYNYLNKKYFFYRYFASRASIIVYFIFTIFLVDRVSLMSGNLLFDLEFIIFKIILFTMAMSPVVLFIHKKTRIIRFLKEKYLKFIK